MQQQNVDNVEFKPVFFLFCLIIITILDAGRRVRLCEYDFNGGVAIDSLVLGVGDTHDVVSCLP